MFFRYSIYGGLNCAIVYQVSGTTVDGNCSVSCFDQSSRNRSKLVSDQSAKGYMSKGTCTHLIGDKFWDLWNRQYRLHSLCDARCSLGVQRPVKDKYKPSELGDQPHVMLCKLSIKGN